MELIQHNGETLAIVDRIENFQPGLNFYGSRDDAIQVGVFNYPQGRRLSNHRHITRRRTVEKTQEIMIVFSGVLNVITFAKEGRDVVDIRKLHAGEFYISYQGGVGFEVLAPNTRMMEIKNGPYNVKNDDEDRELL